MTPLVREGMMWAVIAAIAGAVGAIAGIVVFGLVVISGDWTLRDFITMGAFLAVIAALASMGLDSYSSRDKKRRRDSDGTRH